MLVEQWSITLFGGLSASQSGRTIARFRTQKTAALLAYIAYHRNRAHPREALIDLLWQDADIDAGRISLRTALSSLRAQLEPPGIRTNSVIQADRSSIRLNPDAFTTDVHQFELLLTTPRTDLIARNNSLSRALDLYTGELLPGSYEDWVDIERARLAELALNAAIELAGQLQRIGELPEAIDRLLQALALDPLREETHRSLMLLYAQMNNPRAAVRQYEELSERLKSSFAAVPDANTQQLLKRILAGATGLQETPHLELPDAEKAAEKSSSQLDLTPRKTSSSAAHSRLPLALTRFFGREQELDRVQALLSPAPFDLSQQDNVEPWRLVTVTGFGGAGKTRFAVEAARLLTQPYESRVYFCPLADIHDVRLIIHQLLASLFVPLNGSDNPEAVLLEHLHTHGPCLLILDNLEQLLETDNGSDAVTSLILRMLDAAPNLRIMSTSRTLLGITGEREVMLAPLATPTLKASPELLMEFASVQLFVDRAQCAKPDFQVTSRNSDTIGAICHRLEGIPLAIELTAAWARMLSPTQMLERLESRFELLVSRRRDMPERHRTLRAAIDWSCNLLEPEMQRYLASLSVFVGGWSLEAATEVCNRNDTLIALSYLAERSLVNSEVDQVHDVANRYRMLETVREYAAETLNVDDQFALRQRLAEWCMRLAEESEAHQMGPLSGIWMDRLEADLDNLRASLGWCMEIARSDGGQRKLGAELALRIAAALWRFWYLRGRITEGTEWLRQVLTLESGDIKPDLLAKAMTGSANLATVQGDVDRARHLHVESLEIRRKLGLSEGIVISLSNLGALELNQGHLGTARELLEEALSLARHGSNKHRIANTLNNLGNVASQQKDYDSASRYLHESLALKRVLGDTAGAGTVLSNLGDVAYRLQRYDAAADMLLEALSIKQSVGDKVGATIALTNLGFVHCDSGSPIDARVYFEESIISWKAMGHKQGIANVLEGFARLADFDRNPSLVILLFFAAERLRGEISSPLTGDMLAERDNRLEKARRQVGDIEYASCKLRGTQIEMAAAIDTALARSTIGLKLADSSE